ncbi:MAG: hypothetical protein L6408_01940 [Nanoarchaeota archaeon]|nr:hypothetical protein [Nanoarchaeota archaeon]
MNGENYATPTHRKTKKEKKLKSKERVYKRGGKDRTKKDETMRNSRKES